MHMYFGRFRPSHECEGGGRTSCLLQLLQTILTFQVRTPLSRLTPNEVINEEDYMETHFLSRM